MQALNTKYTKVITQCLLVKGIVSKVLFISNKGLKNITLIVAFIHQKLKDCFEVVQWVHFIMEEININVLYILCMQFRYCRDEVPSGSTSLMSCRQIKDAELCNVNSTLYTLYT